MNTNRATNDNSLTFGIMLGPTSPWSRLAEQARQVESLGFDKLWLPDHFVNPEDKNMDWFECWTTLSALSTYTDTITLGTLVSSMTLRNPALLARTAMTVDHVSGGRLEFGVGAAGSTNCHRMTGVPNWEARERSERYKEFVEIIDQMLVHEVTTYQGNYYSTEEALIRPRSLSKPRPVFSVAAHGLRALRLAATYGDAWNTLTPGRDLTPRQCSDITRERCERMCEFALEANRDPNEIGRTICFGWTSDGLFRSLEAFYDAIGRYREAGMNDFCFIYALGIEGWAGETITTEDLLLQIAHEAVPALRKSA